MNIQLKNLHKRVINQSTIEFFRSGIDTPGYRLRDFIHGYVYVRWPYLYINIGKGDHWLARLYLSIREIFQKSDLKSPTYDAQLPRSAIDANTSTHTFADGYHGKVVPLESAKQLVMVNENIEIRNLEKVLPYTHARDLIMQNPDHLVALECPCRTSVKNPCLPLDVCLIVGEPFASFILDHHHQRARPITPSEAVDILSSEDQRGHVHHAFFKDAMLGRFYAICNCCSCCCGAMNAHQRGTPMLAPSGYTCTVDEALCIGCGSCQEVCQFFAIRQDNGTSIVNDQLCMGCGVCVNQCEQSALSLLRDPSRGEPLEIEHLLAKVK